MSKLNKGIEWTGEFNEDYTKCSLKYGKKEEDITQEEWRDYINCKI